MSRHTSPIFVDVSRGGGPARPMLLDDYMKLADRSAWDTRATPYVRNEDGSRTYLDDSFQSFVGALLGLRQSSIATRH
jgi:hypothetical protein